MNDKSPDNNEKDEIMDVLKESEHSAPSVQQSTTEKKNMTLGSKKGKLVILATLVVGLVLGAFLMLNNDDAPQETATSQNQEAVSDPVVELAAAIGLVEGNVQHSIDGQAWVDAAGGETITAGSYVQTLAGSRTVLLIDDGSAVRLDAGSQVKLAVSDSMAVEIILLSGQAYSRVVESESRTFAVVTETERFEAQGTAYKTTTGEFDEIEVYQSSVKIDSDETTVEEGNKYNTQTKEKSDIDLAALESDDFVQWNKQKDSEKDEFKDKLGVLTKKDEPVDEPVTPPAANAAAVISLSGQATDGGVKLSWVLKGGASSKDGFKLVRDTKDTTPSYGENKSVYVSNGEQRSYTVEIKDGKTYNFRVCIYRAAGGSCDTYSNSITVTAPNVPLEAIVPGALSLSIADRDISWTAAGTAPHGFKVVLSEVSGPTYPANSIQYVSAGVGTVKLPEKPTGTYYVRVCKYTANSEISGGCTDYSNEVQYVVL